MSGWSAATYLAAAAVAVSAGSAVYSGQQQKKAADTQAQIAENNAAYSADSASAMPIRPPIEVPTQCTVATFRRAISVTISATYNGMP